MKIWLVRHAQPAWYPDGTGRNDPGLTELGHTQAAQAAKAATEWDLEELWVSPARRAQETAAAIVETTGLTARTFEWLDEVHTPNFEGLTEKEVVGLFDGARSRTIPQWWEGLKGAGDVEQWMTRLQSGLATQLAEHGVDRDPEHPDVHLGPRPKLRVGIVSHSGTSGALLSHLLGLRQVPWPWIRMGLMHAGVASVSGLDIAHGWIFSLRAFNQAEHLTKRTW